jgi:hypothetical protein
LIQPLYRALNTTSTNFASEFEGACSYFTQDKKVAVVITAIGVISEQFSSCLNQANIPLVMGEYAVGDNQFLGRYGLVLAPSGLTSDRRAASLLKTMTATGYLTRQQTIGVVVDECSHTQRAFTQTFQPQAKSLGLTIVTSSVRCMRGFGDYSGLAADVQSAVLRFGTQNVSSVIFFSDFEASVLLLFAGTAESQRYRPHYALTSAAFVALQGSQGSSSPNQLRNMRGLGWLPSIDSQSSPVVTPAAKACVDVIRKNGASPQGPTDFFYAFGACDTVNLLDAVLTRTRGATSRDSVMAAIGALGTGFRAASTFSSQTDFSSHRDGPAVGRIFSWKPGCSCFGYDGPPRPL